MTRLRIRLDLKIDDLAFRFGISSPHASNIVTTMISFLSRELEPLIYWPTPEQTLTYNSKHFTGNLTKAEGIIDCTEQKKIQNHLFRRLGAKHRVHTKVATLLKSLLFALSQVLLVTFHHHLVDVRQTATLQNNVKFQTNFILR